MCSHIANHVQWDGTRGNGFCLDTMETVQTFFSGALCAKQLTL